MRSWKQRRIGARTIIAGVLACLFVLQGLALAVSPSFQAKAYDGQGSTILASMGGQNCFAHDGESAPAPRDHNHSQCCIYCASSGRELLFPVVAALLGVLVYSPPEAVFSNTRMIADHRRGRPRGWISSWSSRAPPYLS